MRDRSHDALPPMVRRGPRGDKQPVWTGYVKERTLAMGPSADPKLPPPYDGADIAALKALREGRADPHQQTLALEWIVHALCGTYDMPFRPGGEDGRRDTDFACGKQFVGQQIVKLINLPSVSAEQGEQG